MTSPTRTSRRLGASSQRGNFVLGMVVGLLVGLTLALGVALYVTKVPIPFVDKVPQRTAEQDAAEAERNRNWDPNAPLAGKTPVRPEPAASAAVPVTPAPQAEPLPSATTPAAAAASRATAAPKPEAGASRDTAAAASQYFVQIGAYGKSEDAEQQRARLAISGLSARISDREQNGRTVYRVRLGPFDSRQEAEKARDQASAAGHGDAALVHVPR